MSDKEEMALDGNMNVTLTLRLLMHGKVMLQHENSEDSFVMPNEKSCHCCLKHFAENAVCCNLL